MPAKKPVIALVYDFDRTLSISEMQNPFIEKLGLSPKEFWRKSNAFAKENNMDKNLAYLHLLMRECNNNDVPINRDVFREAGKEIEFYPGIMEWFAAIDSLAKELDVTVEHYIISSGLKEMIEGTEPARKGAFTKIYASSFYFNERGVAVWPAQAVNYTNKTQFLFRISKGVLDVNDPGVNDYFEPEDIRVPFRNMVYIGDSDTDIPCMKLVNSYGGHSVGVYNPGTGRLEKGSKMLRENRIRYIAPADYTDGSELDALLKAIIRKTAASEELERKHLKDKKSL